MRSHPISLLFLVTLLGAREHTAIVQPLQIYTYRAAASGLVTESRDDLEGRRLSGERVLTIDSRVDRESLKRLREKVELLKRRIAVEERILKELQRIADIRLREYRRIEGLKTKPPSEKDRRLAAYLSAKERVEGERSKILSLQLQIKDLKLSLAQVEDRIAKKELRVWGYLYRLYPRKGDFVALGAPLADVADISRARVILYLTREEVEEIGRREIYIDGKASNLKFSKLISIPDGKHKGEYRAELILPPPKIFGKLIRIELRPVERKEGSSASGGVKKR
ncbi:MAG: hypothetical protein GXO19_06395 [Epsilonproteobacteria bacterium]|nr:hypothetical protein [Campylobacterota bacterium]NPA57346.1 hypothetical protein [Campylobacterota bacterium]